MTDALDLKTAPRTLLLVDDEQSILSALKRLFRPQGYRVLVADSGEHGLEIARDEPIDLVISDMRMPKMDGAQFLARMREQHPQAVRILLTGYADISSTIAAINGGEIHRYIAKPWDDNDILLIVREALDRRALQERNQELMALTARQNDELSRMNAELESRVRSRTEEIEQVNAMLNVAYADLKSNFMLSIQVFAGLLELRYNGMSGRSRRVSEWAGRVCRRLGLDERSSQDIGIAALLHDVGKIGLPDGLLRKPVSAMTPEELARYRKHPLNAEAALMPLVQLQAVAKIVRAQHERFDGNGFPDGLEGEEIPFGARVLAPIVDYDNLVSGTLAERRFAPEDAAASVRRGVGSRYDARVVEALLAVLQEGPGDAPDDRCIGAAELEAGMVLARNLVSSQGALLLAAGYVFDERVVHQVHEYARREGVKLTLHVLAEPALERQT